MTRRCDNRNALTALCGMKRNLRPSVENHFVVDAAPAAIRLAALDIDSARLGHDGGLDRRAQNGRVRLWCRRAAGGEERF